MFDFILPTIVPGDTVATYSARVVESATRHVEEHEVFTIAHESDVDVSRYDGTRGPGLEWVRDVIDSVCDRIRDTEPWDSLPTYDTGEPVGAGDDDMDPGDVLDELADVICDPDTYTDGWTAISSQSVPCMTHERMLTYVDTCAYREDTTELDGRHDTPVDRAHTALMVQAERIAQATATEVSAVIRSALN